MTSDSSSWDRAADDSTELQEQEHHQQQKQGQAHTSQSERRKLQNRLAQRKFRQKKSQNNKTASQQPPDENSTAAPTTTASAPASSSSSSSSSTLTTTTSMGSIDLSAESLLDLVSSMNPMPPTTSAAAAHPPRVRCSSCGNDGDFPRSASGQSSRGSIGHHHHRHHCSNPVTQPGVTVTRDDFQHSFGSKASTPHSEMGVFSSDAMSMISAASAAMSPGGDICSGLMSSQQFCSPDNRASSHIAPSPAISCSNHTHGSSSSGGSSSNGSPSFSMPHTWDTGIQSQPTTTTLAQQPYVGGPPSQQQQQQSWRPLLHVAAQKGHGNVLQILIEHQVDINERDTNGATALHLAVENRHEAAVRMLLQHGADMNACDNQGRSPFYVAVSQGDEDIVRVFLMYGADPRLRVREHQ